MVHISSETVAAVIIYRQSSAFMLFFKINFSIRMLQKKRALREKKKKLHTNDL